MKRQAARFVKFLNHRDQHLTKSELAERVLNVYIVEDWSELVIHDVPNDLVWVVLGTNYFYSRTLQT